LFGQKLLDRVPCELEHFYVEESNCWAKVQALFYAQLHVTASILPVISLVDRLGLAE